MLWMACDSSGVPANGHGYGAEALVSIRCSPHRQHPTVIVSCKSAFQDVPVDSCLRVSLPILDRLYPRRTKDEESKNHAAPVFPVYIGTRYSLRSTVPGSVG
jgi:hypothetical protein